MEQAPQGRIGTEQAGLAVVRFGLLGRFPLSDNTWMVAARRPRTGSPATPP